MEYFVIELNGTTNSPDFSCYASVSNGRLQDGASVLHCKKWATETGARNALAKSKQQSSYLWDKYRKITVEIISDEDIAIAQSKEEERKFERDLESLYRQANIYINDQTTFSKMKLQLAETLTSLKQGSPVLYYPEGLLKAYTFETVSKVGISTLEVCDRSYSRLTGTSSCDRSCVLPDVAMFWQYFERYALTNAFLRIKFDELSQEDLSRVAKALSSIRDLIE